MSGSFERRWAARLLGGAASAALLAGAAQAQSAPPPAAAADQGGVGVVTVTAERRAENLQKVPISATVRTGAQLKNQNVYSIQQLQNQTPGLTLQPPLSSETFINIRGVGIQKTSPTASNGVAFYVDGVYVPSLIDTVDTFYDLQNVEVLRGPQGTLVGSNSDGGAIFVNSVQPSFDRVKGYIQQTIGNYEDYRTEGGINLPINDMVAARLGFVYETRDSFTTNVGAQTSTPVGGFVTPAFPATYPPAQNQPGAVDFNAVRLQVLFKPTDNVQLTVRFEPYESRGTGFAVKPDEAAAAPLDAYYGLNPNKFTDPWAVSHQNDPFLIDYDTLQYFNIQGQRTSGTLIWHITPNVELRDVASYQNGYEADQTDIDASSAPSGVILDRKATFIDYTEELNLLSTGSGPFQWVVGFYYMNTTSPYSGDFVNGSGITPVTFYHQTYAGFASGTYQFSPQWSLTLGGRYSYDYEPFQENPADLPAGSGLGHTSIPFLRQVSTDAVPSWTVKLNFQVTPLTLVYASVSTGYKAGASNLQVPPNLSPPFKPETNMVEELGLKTDFLDHHLRFDGDIFYSQYNHYQLQEFLTNGFPFTQGPGQANIWGAEGELTGVFNDLQFDLGVSYLNGSTAAAFKFIEPNTSTITVPAGTVIPFAPPWSVDAGIQYSFHVWNGRLTPRIQYEFQDTQYVQLLHIAAAYPLNLGVTIPAHGTADFLLTYAAPEHWQIQGYITNFTNSVYIANALPSASKGQPPVFAYGAPIQYGLRLSYNF